MPGTGERRRVEIVRERGPRMIQLAIHARWLLSSRAERRMILRSARLTGAESRDPEDGSSTMKLRVSLPVTIASDPVVQGKRRR